MLVLSLRRCGWDNTLLGGGEKREMKRARKWESKHQTINKTCPQCKGSGWVFLQTKPVHRWRNRERELSARILEVRPTKFQEKKHQKLQQLQPGYPPCCLTRRFRMLTDETATGPELSRLLEK